MATQFQVELMCIRTVSFGETGARIYRNLRAERPTFYYQMTYPTGTFKGPYFDENVCVEAAKAFYDKEWIPF